MHARKPFYRQWPNNLHRPVAYPKFLSVFWFGNRCFISGIHIRSGRKPWSIGHSYVLLLKLEIRARVVSPYKQPAIAPRAESQITRLTVPHVLAFHPDHESAERVRSSKPAHAHIGIRCLATSTPVVCPSQRAVSAVSRPVQSRRPPCLQTFGNTASDNA